jgi:hypothetical protein
MDSLVFEDTINSELTTSEFVDKQWLYVNDNNNGSYSSQIVIDTTPLANSGGWCNWSEGLILMPLVLQLEGGTGTISATSDTGYDWCVALKNGYWNILHSMNVEFNNGSVIQQTPYMNLWCSFRALTSWSVDDLRDWGAVCGFSPDTSLSWGFNSSATTGSNILAGCGAGLFNNLTSTQVDISAYTWTPTGAPVASATLSLNLYTKTTTGSQDLRYIFNQGLVNRMSYINYDPTLTPSIVGFSLNQNYLMTNTQATLIFKTCVIYQTNSGNTLTTRAVCIDAVIRLKDIADMFCKMPMTKGGTFRMYINTNQVYFQVGQTSATIETDATLAVTQDAFQTLVTAPVILGGGGTNPVMFASAAIGQGSQTLIAPQISATPTAANEIVSVALSIVRTQFSQISNVISCPITSCRLYCPVYTLSPLSEQRLLSLSPTKKVVYEDIFYYQFPNQSGGQNFNLLVSNGIPNIRKVLVQALINKASNGAVYTAGGSTGLTTSTLLSPFCSTGGTPDPISINNFQIQISGKNLFINQLQYDWEEFVEQLVSSNQLNGSLTTSLASGQIGKQDYQSLYRYYYGNASRSIPSEDGVAKAVQILGQINTPTNIICDIVCFISFERDFTIDLRSGARIQ